MNILQEIFKDNYEIIQHTLHPREVEMESFFDDGFWRVVKHFNYILLRKSSQTALLNPLESSIGPSFKKTKAPYLP